MLEHIITLEYMVYILIKFEYNTWSATFSNLLFVRLYVSHLLQSKPSNSFKVDKCRIHVKMSHLKKFFFMNFKMIAYYYYYKPLHYISLYAYIYAKQLQNRT